MNTRRLTWILICFLLVGCDRQDGRITQLSEEVTDLRQEVRHLRGLKAEVDRLDQELKQSRTATTSASLAEQSNSTAKSTGETTANLQGISSEARARLGNATATNSGRADSAVFDAQTTAVTSYLDDPFLGSKDAPVVVMAFIDYQSRASAMFYKTIFLELSKEFIDKSQIRFVVRDYPLESNVNAIMAAQIANCAGEQGKYWDIFRSFFEEPQIVEKADWSKTTANIKNLDRNKLRKCIKANRYQKEITADQEEGKQLGITGTPSFFIAKVGDDKQISGTVIRGAQPYPLIRKYIKTALKSAK